MKYAAVVIYLLVGVGASIGIDRLDSNPLPISARIFIAATWPTFVSFYAFDRMTFDLKSRVKP
jgi:hypothetical protein